jgi:hypothetical protein
VLFVVCARAAKELARSETARRTAVVAREKRFMLKNLQIRQKVSKSKETQLKSLLMTADC